MNKEQSAAYVFAQSVSALAEIEGMKAENTMRQLQGEYPVHDIDDFNRVINRYGIHHNSVINTFQGAEG